MENIIDMIQKATKDTPTNFIILLLANSINYLQTNLDVLKYLINEVQMNGIYITINRPAMDMIKNLQKVNINTKNLFFIDCISETAKGNIERTDNILYTSSPKNLTDIGIAISEITKSLKDPSNYFLFLDSVSTLLIYNSARSIVQFSHFLINVIRTNNLNGVIMSVESETDNFVKRTLYVLCDKVIYSEDNK